MSNIRNFLLITIIFLQCGCETNRKIGEKFDDFMIDLSAKKEIYKINPHVEFSINRDVYKGNILLTGSVPSFSEKEKIEIALKSIKDIKNIYNHLIIHEGSIKEYAYDKNISKEINLNLIFDDEIKRNNIFIRVYAGTVYLLGSVHTQHEKEKIFNYVRNIHGVKNVISYLSTLK